MLAFDLPLAPAHRSSSVPSRVFVLADDLTGALDSAVHFASADAPVHHRLRSAASKHARSSYSLETRNATPEVAAEAVRRALATARLTPDTLVFLKLDSAGRGPIAATILTTAEVLRPQAILFTPASPLHGRTVQNSELTIKDITGLSTSLPLLSLFPADVHHRIAPLPTGSVNELREHMLQSLAQGRDIFLADTMTTADLENLTAAAQSLPQPIVWAGSSGLASALTMDATKPAPILPSTHPLLLCGTPHPVTQMQLEHLRGQRDATIFQFDPATTTPAQLQSHFTAHQPGSLLITGGDTAAFVLAALDAASIAVHGELSPGIPWGRIHGGLADDAIVATKSGGFGDEQALTQAIDRLTGAYA